MLSIILLFTTACTSGVSLYVDNERTALQRNLARITDAENTDRTYFQLTKRNREVMAEHEIWGNEKMHLLVGGGRGDRGKRWNSGLVLRYEY